MKKASRLIAGKELVNKTLNWVDGCACKIIEKGLIAKVSVEAVDPNDDNIRTHAQNAKMWVLFTDLEEQLLWHGQKMSKEDWKDLLGHEWQAQKIIPAISGGFCILNARTSKANKRSLSDLIEITYAFGSSNSVKWSSDSISAYEEYCINEK